MLPGSVSASYAYARSPPPANHALEVGDLRTPPCCLGAAVILRRRVPAPTGRVSIRGSADFMNARRGSRPRGCAPQQLSSRALRQGLNEASYPAFGGFHGGSWRGRAVAQRPSRTALCDE